jgi:hypothetical protein
MAEIRTVTTLRYKRDEILASIRLYEKQLDQARADLAHINAAIKIFEASGDPKQMARYIDTHRLFKRGEPVQIAKEALASGPKTTTEIALHLMEVKGLDPNDKVLARAVGQQLVHSIRMQEVRGLIKRAGKKGTSLVWALP